MRLFLRGKNIIRNQILVSKLWYIGQIYTIPKYQKGNWKKYIQFSLKQEITTSWTLSSTPHLEGQASYFTVLDRHTIKLDKNKLDSKFTKSHQCSLKKGLMLYWLKLILNSDQDLPFLDKNRFLQVYSSQKFTKTEQWRFLYSITLCLATSHQ